MLYQKFLVSIDEEEGWLSEKITLVSSDEVGDTLAAVQVQNYLLGSCIADIILTK